MLSYQYRNFHYKDKTVSWPSYLYNGNPLTWKDHFYIETGPKWLLHWPSMTHFIVSLAIMLSTVNAPLPQRPVARRKLVGKRIFHFRPISSDIGRTHFNLSRKDGAGTLLAGVWSEQPVGNLIVKRHWWDTGRTFSSGLDRSSSEKWRTMTGR